MVEECSVHARKTISHMRTANGIHLIAFWLSILHIPELRNLIRTFNLMLIIITGDMIEVCSVHARSFHINIHLRQTVHIS